MPAWHVMRSRVRKACSLVRPLKKSFHCWKAVGSFVSCPSCIRTDCIDVAVRDETSVQLTGGNIEIECKIRQINGYR